MSTKVFRNKRRIHGRRPKWVPEYVEITSVQISKEDRDQKSKRIAEMIWSWAQKHQDEIEKMTSEPLHPIEGFKEILSSRCLSNGIPVVGKRQTPITQYLLTLSEAAARKLSKDGNFRFRHKTDLEVLRFSALQLQEYVYYQINDGEQRLSQTDAPQPIGALSWIVWHPNLFDGWPTIRGTTLTVSLALFCLADSKSPKEIREIFGAFPHGCIPEVLRFASEQLIEERQYEQKP
jgi:uncharacterized protein (DUF433 family)